MTYAKSTFGRLADSWTMKAHDIRAVSARIYLAAEELSQSEDARTRKLGERAMQACDCIVDMCQDATRAHKKRCQSTLAEMLQLLVEMANFAAGPGTRVYIDVEYDAQILDRGTSLFRIMTNLVNNAVAAVNEVGGGAVLVRSTREGKRTVLIVENFGLDAPGATGTSEGNTGLGLLIASELAEDLGVKLERPRFTGQGALFRLTLPPELIGPRGAPAAPVSPVVGRDAMVRAG